MMAEHKPKDIPFSKMQKISEDGIFIKRFGQFGKTTMKSYAHRDDYYIFVLLTKGSAAVEIDFERKKLTPGDLLILSPWQVHSKPSDETWLADGWMLAFSPELLSESDVRAIEEYSISLHPFNPGERTLEDLVTLFNMLERYQKCDTIFKSLGSTIKSIIISALDITFNEISDRYMSITLKFRELIDSHLASEKRPAAYASLLNISEVYLNEAVKGTTGLSVGAYIRSRVIVEAKRQLAYTSLTAKEIAYSLGYEDYAYFSKLFRKIVGKSPVDYRKNLK